MAKPLSMVDAAVIRQADVLATNVRNVMLFTRAMRSGEYELNADTLKIVEDFLFVLTVDQAAFTDKVRSRLSDYADLAEAAREVTADLFPVDLPRALSSVIVSTGTYRPLAANDVNMGVSA